MKTKTIRQTYTFDSSPLKVYEILMNAEHHAAFTESKVKISDNVNERFSVFDGYATGRNIELIKGEKIVQTWHCADFEEGHETRITFLLKRNKAGGCELDFSQTNVPEKNYKSLSRGWIEHYWEAMAAYLLVQKKS